jgi:hypothetical protein
MNGLTGEARTEAGGCPDDPLPVAELISPSGERVTVFSVSAFCRENGLDTGNLCKVIQGERQHHKGWRSAFPAPPGAFAHKPHAIERYLG